MSALEKLGYHFNENGVLLKGENGFEFTNQEDYETLGEAVTEEIYKLLETSCGLVKAPLHPLGKPENPDNLSFIFHTPRHETKETLLVLFHGSGVVRAGQWARKLILNKNLECGSQMPYIDRAHENGWGVVVFNANDNQRNGRQLKYSETPTDHVINAWRAFVNNSTAKTILVVAHSRGGADFEDCLTQFGDDPRIVAACLTDSCNLKLPSKCLKRVVPIFIINFVCKGPIDRYTIAEHDTKRIQRVWAGTDVHELSSYQAIEAVFHVLEKGINYDNYMEVFEEAKQLVLIESEVRYKLPTEEELDEMDSPAPNEPGQNDPAQNEPGQNEPARDEHVRNARLDEFAERHRIIINDMLNDMLFDDDNDEFFFDM